MGFFFYIPPATCRRHRCLSVCLSVCQNSYIVSHRSITKQQVYEMCCTENRRRVPPKASSSCFTRCKCFLQTSGFVLLERRRPLAKRQTFSMNQEAVTPLASWCQNSLIFSGSTLESRSVCESVQRSRRSVRGWGSCKIQKNTLLNL